MRHKFEYVGYTGRGELAWCPVCGMLRHTDFPNGLERNQYRFLSTWGKWQHYCGACGDNMDARNGPPPKKPKKNYKAAGRHRAAASLDKSFAQHMERPA